MNIAFVEALKQYGFQCFVFHDVDLVPEDDRNMYSCPIQPRHMSVAIDEMGYKYVFSTILACIQMIVYILFTTILIFNFYLFVIIQYL